MPPQPTPKAKHNPFIQIPHNKPCLSVEPVLPSVVVCRQNRNVANTYWIGRVSKGRASGSACGPYFVCSTSPNASSTGAVYILKPPVIFFSGCTAAPCLRQVYLAPS